MVGDENLPKTKSKKRPRLCESEEERQARHAKEEEDYLLNYTWEEYNVYLYDLKAFLGNKMKDRDFYADGVSLMEMILFNQKQLNSVNYDWGDCAMNGDGEFFRSNSEGRLRSKDPNYNIRLRNTRGFFTQAIPLTLKNIEGYGYEPIERALSQLLFDTKEETKKKKATNKMITKPVTRQEADSTLCNEEEVPSQFRYVIYII